MSTFVEVASTTSFTVAAERLGLSRLQVTRHIQALEDWLKLRLLHRTTRKVSLTPAGEETLILCQRILGDAALLNVQSLNQQSQLTGTIRIASPIGLAQNLLIDIIANFTELHPAVTIDVVASDSHSELVEDRVDVALRYTEQPADTLIARKLMVIDSVIVASPDYIKKFGQPEHPADLSAHNCLVHTSNKAWRFTKNGEETVIKVKSNIRANALEMLVTLAKRGKGIAWVPCDLANKAISEGTLLPLLNDYQTIRSPLWAVYLSRSYQTPLVRHFIDYVAQQWHEDIVREQ